MEIEGLRVQYSNCAGKAKRLQETMVEQLTKLLDGQNIALGVPMESRVKAWSSIEEKVKRKALNVEDLESLDDLIGVRLILLFRRDVAPVEELIGRTFEVLSSEDTAERLGDGQFGYQSKHFILRLPKAWLAIPSMADLGDLKVEVQVRTLAQHIWAAASHKLQYKHESSVPPPLRRTINRVSALLETVDLEFDRVLDERQDYRDVGISAAKGTEPLNVDLLGATLAQYFPAENRDVDEDYEDLIVDLKLLSIGTVKELKDVLERRLEAAMEEERITLARRIKNKDPIGTSIERLNRGVFFTHVGLARAALRAEFGKRADEAFDARRQKAPISKRLASARRKS